jgi:hypothetical protein
VTPPSFCRLLWQQASPFPRHFAMPVPTNVEEAACTMQPSANPRKRKINHDHSRSNASLHPKRPLSLSLDSVSTTLSPHRNPKRLRLKASSSSHHGSNPNPTQPHKHDPPTPIASLLLRPCHVCWRRPTTRAVLDGYADCEGCGSRTCYICLRECEDDNCKLATVDLHQEDVTSGFEVCAGKIRKRRVCSLCVVEYIDTDGGDMTRCLDCADLVHEWE